jgi:hypothetical protein
MLLCHQWWSIDQLMKKRIGFNVKTKFHFEWKYYMTLHANSIQLKRNGIQIDGEGIEIYLWIWCYEQETLERHIFKKHNSMAKWLKESILKTKVLKIPRVQIPFHLWMGVFVNCFRKMFSLFSVTFKDLNVV